MSRIKFLTLIILLTFIMGASIAVVKIGLVYSSPLLLASFRFLFAGLFMVLTVLMIRKKHPQTVSEWLKMLTIGAFQSAGVSVGIFVGLRTATTSEISVLTYTSPLFVVMIGTVFLQMRYHWIQWIGVVLGIIGVAITLNAQIELKVGLIYGIFAAVCWAIATLLIKKWGNSLDIWVLSAYQMLFGGFLLLAFSFTLETPVFRTNPASIFVVLWLVIMASIIQNVLWFYLMKKEDAAKVSSFLFLAPFFGVFSGWLLLNDPLSFSSLAGGALIIVGIYMVNRNTGRQPVKLVPDLDNRSADRLM